MTNISLMIDDVKFNFRVALIPEYNGKYLLQKTPDVAFYGLVGGRVEAGEDTYTAIARETEEELGFKPSNDMLNLVSISEAFFTHKNTKFHELLYVFKIKLTDDFDITKKDNFAVLDKETSILKWYTKEEVKKMNILPEIVYELLDQDILIHRITT